MPCYYLVFLADAGSFSGNIVQDRRSIVHSVFHIGSETLAADDVLDGLALRLVTAEVVTRLALTALRIVDALLGGTGNVVTGGRQPDVTLFDAPLPVTVMRDVSSLVVRTFGCPFPVLWKSLLPHANNNELMSIQSETGGLRGPDVHVMVHRDVVVGKPRVPDTVLLAVLVIQQEAAAGRAAMLVWIAGSDHSVADLVTRRDLHECLPQSIQCFFTLGVFEDASWSADDGALELSHNAEIMICACG